MYQWTLKAVGRGLRRNRIFAEPPSSSQIYLNYTEESSALLWNFTEKNMADTTSASDCMSITGRADIKHLQYEVLKEHIICVVAFPQIPSLHQIIRKGQTGPKQETFWKPQCSSKALSWWNRRKADRLEETRKCGDRIQGRVLDWTLRQKNNITKKKTDKIWIKSIVELLDFI